MSSTGLRLVALCGLTLAAGGCGGSGDVGDAGPDPADKRAVALECITKSKQLPARLDGETSIQLEGSDAPRIEFFTNTGEAEGKQFLGGAQAAEQIGASLLYVNRADDELLAELEECLGQ